MLREKVINEIEYIENNLIHVDKDIAEAPLMPDENDQASAITQQEIHLQTTSKQRARLQVLKLTLKKIDIDPNYGVCECGNDIGKARLLAIPETNLCILCAQSLEE